MKVSFKQPVKLGNSLYPRGEHEVPAADLNHWFIQALIKDGNASVVEALLDHDASVVTVIKSEVEEPALTDEVSSEQPESAKDQKKKRRK